MGIIDELGSYDQEITDKEKETKAIRTLAKSFKPIEIVRKFTQMSFNDFVQAMNAEIERQKNIRNPSNWSPNKSTYKNVEVYYSNKTNIRGDGRERCFFQGPQKSRKSNGRGTHCGDFKNPNENACQYCGKLENFIKKFRLRIQEKEIVK